MSLSGERLVADEDQLGDHVAEQGVLIDRLAAAHNIERVRAGADRYLFVAGLEDPSDGADEAIEFAAVLAQEISDLAVGRDVTVELQIGLSTGPVATGLLEQGSLTFNVWGEPVRRALAISALSQPHETLLDPSTCDAASASRWHVEPASDIIDLDGKGMNAMRLVSPVLGDSPISTGIGEPGTAANHDV
jgi:class 3 adenylate cyclase